MKSEKIVLESGVVLEVGKKYRLPNFLFGEFVEIKAFDGDVVLVRNWENVPFIYAIKQSFEPYICRPLTTSFKTFLIEVEHKKSSKVYQFIILTDSIETARKIHPKAKTIVETKINLAN